MDVNPFWLVYETQPVERPAGMPPTDMHVLILAQADALNHLQPQFPGAEISVPFVSTAEASAARWKEQQTIPMLGQDVHTSPSEIVRL